MRARVCEILGLVLGGTASLVVVVVAMMILALSKFVISLVKIICLPLVLMASLIYPDERSLRQRVVQDVTEWWRLTEVAL